MRFYYNIYKKDNKIFTTSLYKINCLIKERLQDKDKDTKKEIKRCLLNVYKGYINMFFKVASN